VKTIKKASEIREMLESVINENRLKIIVVDAPEAHSERILDVLNKTLQKESDGGDVISLEPPPQQEFEVSVPTPESNRPLRKNPADRSDFVIKSPMDKPHFRDICKCNTCGFIANRNIMGVPCRSISCPKCGAAMCEMPDTQQGDQHGIYIGSKPSSTGNI